MESLTLEKGKFPLAIVRDIERVKSILRRYGAKKIILYGSLARGDYKADSDIDICYEGIPDKYYFRVIAECLMITQRRINILDFENMEGYFKDRVLKEGRIIYELPRTKE